ncbi:hypothetical protein STANM309S_02840 [Streptomyces tanashiensis]
MQRVREGRKGTPSGSTAAAPPEALLGCPDQTAVPAASARAAVTARARRPAGGRRVTCAVRAPRGRALTLPPPGRAGV